MGWFDSQIGAHQEIDPMNAMINTQHAKLAYWRTFFFKRENFFLKPFTVEITAKFLFTISFQFQFLESRISP